MSLQSNVQYVEKALGGGFLSVHNLWIAEVSGAKLKGQVKGDEIGTFDQNFITASIPTWSNWSIDCSFIATVQTTGHTAYTGGSLQVGTLTGTTNGLLLMQTMFNRQVITFTSRIATAFVLRGQCYISDYSLDLPAGKNISGSVTLTGVGVLSIGTT